MRGAPHVGFSRDSRYRCEWREPKVLIIFEQDEQGRMKRKTRTWIDSPHFGAVQLGNVPAWMVMDLIAAKDLTDGRWEKTETGYTLKATSSLREKPNPARTVLLWLGTAALLGLALAGGVLAVRRQPARVA